MHLLSAHEKVVMRQKRQHVCGHTLLHMLWVTAAVFGWLYWSGAYGLRWVTMLSQYGPSGYQGMLWCAVGAGWIMVVMPWMTGAVYALSLGHCLTFFSLSSVPSLLPAHHTIERIIFSPEAAHQYFGICGTITLERDTEE